ncbi:hypothetical protein K432DRAFT_410301 [Lepidopterella palustris CBS 459.81]|uniref:Uncharacterized protein n=1 Tax=Lepidopterella palustris CBS 459.81 TaxID=1314670 RepID=A0A8E2DYH7_9PEZI|nr:hypothetical protein K432DRAFT_410301 [Lepidopterella palustris CBS 459.81]
MSKPTVISPIKVRVAKHRALTPRCRTKCTAKNPPIRAINLSSAWLDPTSAISIPFCGRKSAIRQGQRSHRNLEVWLSGSSDDKVASEADIHRAVESLHSERLEEYKKVDYSTQNIGDACLDFALAFDKSNDSPHPIASDKQESQLLVTPLVSTFDLQDVYSHQVHGGSIHLGRESQDFIDRFVSDVDEADHGQHATVSSPLYLNGHEEPLTKVFPSSCC